MEDNDGRSPMASIPDASLIPRGWYCYESIGEMDGEGLMEIKGVCPYYKSLPDEHAYCGFMDYTTNFQRELLWDQVKICGVSSEA